MNNFIKIFDAETISLSIIYTPTGNLAFYYNMFQEKQGPCITIKASRGQDGSEIPYLYSFAFILDPRMRMTCLFDLLTLVGMHMCMNYVETIYDDSQR